MELLQDIVTEAEYNDIVGKLEDSYLVDKLNNSDEWKIVIRAAKHLRDVTQEQYNHLDHTDPDSKLRSIQCQVVIQFYDDFLSSLVVRYKAIGEEAYKHAEDLGIIERLSLLIKHPQ